MESTAFATPGRSAAATASNSISTAIVFPCSENDIIL
jgi:hypothetical protein